MANNCRRSRRLSLLLLTAVYLFCFASVIVHVSARKAAAEAEAGKNEDTQDVNNQEDDNDPSLQTKKYPRGPAPVYNPHGYNSHPATDGSGSSKPSVSVGGGENSKPTSTPINPEASSVDGSSGGGNNHPTNHGNTPTSVTSNNGKKEKEVPDPNKLNPEDYQYASEEFFQLISDMRQSEKYPNEEITAFFHKVEALFNERSQDIGRSMLEKREEVINNIIGDNDGLKVWWEDFFQGQRDLMERAAAANARGKKAKGETGMGGASASDDDELQQLEQSIIKQQPKFRLHTRQFAKEMDRLKSIGKTQPEIDAFAEKVKQETIAIDATEKLYAIRKLAKEVGVTDIPKYHVGTQAFSREVARLQSIGTPKEDLEDFITDARVALLDLQDLYANLFLDGELERIKFTKEPGKYNGFKWDSKNFHKEVELMHNNPQLYREEDIQRFSNNVKYAYVGESYRGEWEAANASFDASYYRDRAIWENTMVGAAMEAKREKRRIEGMKNGKTTPQQQPTSQTSSSHPSSQPTIASTTPIDEPLVYESVYDELFQPQLEEYDQLKFDPYSLSGAPLGGWGRATRSRLASLPIRLVSDFDGGFDLLYGSSGGDGEDAEDGGVEEESQGGENGDSKATTQDGGESTPAGASSSKSTTLSATKNVKRSTGPHFVIHDSAGQNYVCRVYAEDELVVLSRIDSVFHPAVAIGDDGATTDDAIANTADEKQGKSEDEGLHFHKKFHFNIGGGVKVNHVAPNGDSLPEGLRDTVTKMLQKIGRGGAANQLNGNARLQHIAENPELYINGGEGAAGIDLDGEFDVEVHVVDMDGNDILGEGVAEEIAAQLGGGGVNDVMANEMANIIKAAAVGAGMDKGGSSGDSGDNKKKDGRPKKTPSPAQLTPDQIYEILTQLKGLCSQIHLGWWSYEWCHQEQIRQFHVAVSSHPTQGPKYGIEDVTLIGKWDGKVQVIQPKGVYDGHWKKGTTQTIKFDSRGTLITSTSVNLTPQEDAKYSKGFHPKDPILDNKRPAADRKEKNGHASPIIRQFFGSGEYCPETGSTRSMHVEMRCCTEDEIDAWLESKKQRKKGSQNQIEKKDKTPLAVLVGVEEDETCAYRSRVCTPLLCPKPLSPTKPTASKKLTPEEIKRDPIGSLLTAVFGADIAADQGEVQVYFPDQQTGAAFEALLSKATAGVDFRNDPSFARVKEALQKARGKKFNMKDVLGSDDDGADVVSGGKASSVMIVKEGESIRSILDKTLGNRPCLMKNLGWWTYEFCHAKQIRQYHANNLVDANTGFAKQTIETEHFLGIYEGSGNDEYPNEDEHLHVMNATDSASDVGIGPRKGSRNVNSGNKSGKQPGGNGAVYVQEYDHGDVCDHEDVAESVIKGGSIVHGSVERSSTVRFSCGKRWELIDIKEDSTCHYLIDVTVPELCQHELFKAPVTKTQVVKCLPV